MTLRTFDFCVLLFNHTIRTMTMPDDACSTTGSQWIRLVGQLPPANRALMLEIGPITQSHSIGYAFEVRVAPPIYPSLHSNMLRERTGSTHFILKSFIAFIWKFHSFCYYFWFTKGDNYWSHLATVFCRKSNNFL